MKKIIGFIISTGISTIIAFTIVSSYYSSKEDQIDIYKKILENRTEISNIYAKYWYFTEMGECYVDTAYNGNKKYLMLRIKENE